MILTVKERIVLLGSLPKEANLVTLKLRRSLEDLIGFGEDEMKELELRVDALGTHWNDEKEVEKDFLIGEKMTDMIVASLRQLDQASRLTTDHLSLVDKFIGE